MDKQIATNASANRHVTLTNVDQVMENPDHLNSYASYLKALYVSMSHSHTFQHWTHLPRHEHMQLAVITGEQIQDGEPEAEMVRLAQLGDVDTTLSQKKPIALENLLEAPLPRLVLIEGAPEVGKSTLALHICYKWAQDPSFFGEFDIVILVRLQDQAVQEAHTLADILPGDSIEMCQTVATQMKACDARKVLFIFDGWDVYPVEFRNNSPVSEIIKKVSFDKSTIIVTSRQVASGYLLIEADRRVEILGFTRKQICEYIKKSLNGSIDHDQTQKLVQHLEKHPVIEGYCYIPLHVAMLVYVFQIKGVLPTTLHELVYCYVLCSITKPFSSLTALCKLAYEGCEQNKVVFYQNDFNDFNPHSFLELLQAAKGLTPSCKSPTYYFFHLSVQNLLAAYHISMMDPGKQEEVFKKLLFKGRSKAVLCYYSGITKLRNSWIPHFISMYSAQQKSFRDILPLVHCVYEAQHPSLCQHIDCRFHGLKSYDDFIRPLDHLLAGFFMKSLLSTTCENVNEVKLELDETTDYHCLKLLLDTKQPLAFVPSSVRIILHMTQPTAKGSKIIADSLNDSIEELCLRSGKIDEDVLLNLLTTLRSTHLTKLQLSNMGLQYTKENESAILGMLESNKSLVHLDLSSNQICDMGACIFQRLQQSTAILQLNLSNTRISATDATTQALRKMLRENKTLKHLDLSQNKTFSDLGAQCVCQGLQHNTTLVSLDLSNTRLTDEGAVYIAQLLTSNNSLRTLDISQNSIGVDGFDRICKALELTTALTKLKIHHNKNNNFYIIHPTIEALNTRRQKHGLIPIDFLPY